MTGGYAGGQAELVRVPYADYGPVKVPDDLLDEKVLFLSDIFPTGWQAAVQCDITEGDTVAVWGCGPVGQFAVRSAKALGAEKVFAIDRHPFRLAMAAQVPGVVMVHFDEDPVYEVLMDHSGGRGPDACIDAVGLEAYGHAPDALYDRIKTSLGLATDRGHALRQAIRACRKGGTISIPGVYGGFLDKFPVGALFGKGLTLRGGQTHVRRWTDELLERIRSEQIDPTFVITHRLPLEQAREGYELFKREQNRCVKVVLAA
jgi:threonine dehydrogenase-like Zn-dependent dehydrogenase